MTRNSLSPAYVRINYQSAFGPHVSTVPSVELVEGFIGPSGWGFNLRGAAATTDVGAAITDYVNVIKTQFAPDTIFSDYVVYRQTLPADIAQPVLSGSLNIAGTDTGGPSSKAVQETWTFRADDFGLFKLVFLDVRPPLNFAKLTSLTGDVSKIAIKDYVTAPVTWVAARSGGRPNTFLQLATTLNEKLRRSYGMN